VEQWRCEFLKFTTMREDCIWTFQSGGDYDFFFENKNKIEVIVATYSMLGMTGNRAKESMAVMEHIREKTWGLILLDEVHVIGARTFQTVIHETKAHCKLGLTATLVREDDTIDDLNFLIGPKLYEANWIDLTNEGYIANVMCCEVWCAMSAEFMQRYLDASNEKLKRLLYQMNPNKFRTCQWLVREHEKRGDKIIIFSDTLMCLHEYAAILQRPIIHGAVPLLQRLEIFKDFNSPDGKLLTILVSKVGDNAIDLPSANVIIQVSSHFAARRQEAQRLGRILRPKARTNDKYNAFFYSLISKDTKETYYSTKRQRFLVEQGYAFKVLDKLVTNETPGLHFETDASKEELLADVLARQGHADTEIDNENTDIALDKDKAKSRGGPRSNIYNGSMSLSGGQRQAVKSMPKGKTKRHPLFAKRYASLSSKGR